MKDSDDDAVERGDDSAVGNGIAGKLKEWRNDYKKLVGEKTKKRLATMITINNELMEKAMRELERKLHEMGNGKREPLSGQNNEDPAEEILHRNRQGFAMQNVTMTADAGVDMSRIAFEDLVESIPQYTLGKDIKRLVDITEETLEEPEKSKWLYSSTGIAPRIQGPCDVLGGRQERVGENSQRGNLAERLQAGQEVLPAGMWDEAGESFYIHRSLTDDEFIIWMRSFDLSAKSRIIRGMARRERRMQKATHDEKSRLKFSLHDYGVSLSWVESRYRKAEHLRTKLFSDRIPDRAAEKRLARALNGLLKNAGGFIEQKKLARL